MTFEVVQGAPEADQAQGPIAVNRNQRPKVGIVTPLVDFSPSYSPTGIILDQARMLHRAGYEYDLLVHQNFKEQDKRLAVLNPAPPLDGGGKRVTPLNVRYVLAQQTLHDYQVSEDPQADFESQVKVFLDGNDKGMGYVKALEPYDVIISHDLMFTGWHLTQNKAIRTCVANWPDKRWLHWCHSGASFAQSPKYPSTLRYQGCPNSLYIGLNFRARQDLANMMQITAHDIGVVYNTKDVRDAFGFSDETNEIIKYGNLLDHEVLQVYPFSTPRWEPKGVKQLLRVFGAWRKMGIKAKLVLVNAHCTQDCDREQVRKIEDYTRQCGLLLDRDVIITSRFVDQQMKLPGGDRWAPYAYSVPARIVGELQTASNMFIFPSRSEGCSLIQAESSISGKFCVLNKDFPPMLEFGSDQTLAYEFTRNDPDGNPTYYECVAREIWAYIQRDPIFTNTTIARCQTYNRDWIWTSQMEPLLHLGRN